MGKKTSNPPPPKRVPHPSSVPLVSVSEADLRSAFIEWLQRYDVLAPTEQIAARAEFEASPIEERADLYANYIWTILNRPLAA